MILYSRLIWTWNYPICLNDRELFIIWINHASLNDRDYPLQLNPTTT